MVVPAEPQLQKAIIAVCHCPLRAISSVPTKDGPYVPPDALFLENLLRLRQASRYKERIVPVVYKQCDTDALSRTLSSIEWVDFLRDFDEACIQLLRIWQLKISQNISARSIDRFHIVAKMNKAVDEDTRGRQPARIFLMKPFSNSGTTLSRVGREVP